MEKDEKRFLIYSVVAILLIIFVAVLAADITKSLKVTPEEATVDVVQEQEAPQEAPQVESEQAEGEQVAPQQAAPQEEVPKEETQVVQ